MSRRIACLKLSYSTSPILRSASSPASSISAVTRIFGRNAAARAAAAGGALARAGRGWPRRTPRHPTRRARGAGRSSRRRARRRPARRSAWACRCAPRGRSSRRRRRGRRRLPLPTPAQMAAPSAVASGTAATSTGRSRTSLTSWVKKALRERPPAMRIDFGGAAAGRFGLLDVGAQREGEAFDDRARQVSPRAGARRRCSWAQREVADREPRSRGRSSPRRRAWRPCPPRPGARRRPRRRGGRSGGSTSG